MQFIIAVTLLLIFSSVYLLYQFWSRSLLDDTPVSDGADASAEPQEESALPGSGLRAA